MRMSTRLPFLPFWTLSKVQKNAYKLWLILAFKVFWLDIMFENHHKKSHFTQLTRYPLSEIGHATSSTAQF